MKFYHAGIIRPVFSKYHALFPDKPLNILQTFGSEKTDMSFFIRNRAKFGSFIFDSGTFPAQKKEDNTVNVETYLDYLEDYGHHFDFYFNFDRDFSEDGFSTNWHNQRILETAGLSPVPVLHNIYDDELEFYIDKGYQRIALGSSQVTGVEQMVHVMRRLNGTGIKIHLFGNSKFEFLANFPIDSADSTTASKTGAYGDVLYWNPLNTGMNKTERIYLEERIKAKVISGILYSDYKFRKEFDQFLRQTFDLTYYDLIGDQGDYNKRLVTTYYYVQLEEAVNQLHARYGLSHGG